MEDNRENLRVLQAPLSSKGNANFVYCSSIKDLVYQSFPAPMEFEDVNGNYGGPPAGLSREERNNKGPPHSARRVLGRSRDAETEWRWTASTMAKRRRRSCPVVDITRVNDNSPHHLLPQHHPPPQHHPLAHHRPLPYHHSADQSSKHSSVLDDNNNNYDPEVSGPSFRRHVQGDVRSKSLQDTGLDRGQRGEERGGRVDERVEKGHERGDERVDEREERGHTRGHEKGHERGDDREERGHEIGDERVDDREERGHKRGHERGEERGHETGDGRGHKTWDERGMERDTMMTTSTEEREDSREHTTLTTEQDDRKTGKSPAPARDDIMKTAEEEVVHSTHTQHTRVSLQPSPLPLSQIGKYPPQSTPPSLFSLTKSDKRLQSPISSLSIRSKADKRSLQSSTSPVSTRSKSDKRSLQSTPSLSARSKADKRPHQPNNLPVSFSSLPAKPVDREIPIKLILLGDYGVCKSQLIQALSKATTPGEADIRCAAFRPRELVELAVTAGGRRMRVKIVDTAGQERFRSLTSSYFRAVQGCLLVFNLTRQDSFNSIMTWFSDMQKYSGGNVNSTLLLGLTTPSQSRDEREVTPQRALRLAENLRTQYLETTLQDGEMLRWVVQRLVNKVLRHMGPLPGNPLDMLTISPGASGVKDRGDSIKKRFALCATC